MSQVRRIRAMIATLKVQMAKVETMGDDDYKRLVAILDRTDQQDLKLIAAAGIKFMSPLALNRVKK